MRSLRFIAPLLLAAGFLFLIFFYRAEINDFFSRSRGIVVGVLDGTFNYSEFLRLRAENAGLRATSELGASTSVAGVYSRYPFNDRRLIVINLGERDGVKIGMPVLASEKVILGRITAVRHTQATVQTLFDPEWRESVAIGENLVKALLKGGLPPTLELIDREARIAEGASVFNLSPELPLHFFLGKVSGVRAVAGEPWQKAELQTPYDLDNLNQVFVIKDFP